MTRTAVAVGALAAVLLVLGLAVAYRVLEWATSPAIAFPLPQAPAETDPAGETHRGFLYGRITTLDGATYEGRLRFGVAQEAFWGDYFNGAKDENPWVADVPIERLPNQRRALEIFGVEIGHREHEIDLGRPFMARFGDIARIEARGGDVRVTLKSGTLFDLDRFSASDFDDGVRVWDATRGVVDLDSLWIRTIELLPTASLADAAPYRLHGTVRTRQGEFTGFVQWDREECVGTDELDGRTAEGELGLRFDTIRSIARRSRHSSLVTLLDGREIVLSATREVGHGNRGVYVDDPRYGRVLISWDAFERIDFSPGGSGPAYDDFPRGRPLTGRVTTRAGRLLAGRLVYDLDESETVETLDAPSGGVDYTVPFGLIASIAPSGCGERGGEGATVILHGGEELQLECTGDLGAGNAGMLIFPDGRSSPEYVPWAEVEQVEFDRPPATYPPLPG
ncbi:MAG TPA: hypothetical protein VD788_05860 [Candidatus Polarisedimenticolaceae bacterium]|nr:hypothetical protein [Candidatus Polarisedimenticolaceae bacterium]